MSLHWSENASPGPINNQTPFLHALIVPSQTSTITCLSPLVPCPPFPTTPNLLSDPPPILLTMPTYFGLKGPACCMTLLSSPRFSRLGHMLFPVLTLAAGMLAACIIKSTRSAAKVWSRRFRAPPYIIPNCKFLIQLVDTFEEVRGLSPAEMQVRTDFRDRLPEALKEINTHLLEAEFGQFGKEMPTLLYFHHAHASMRPRRNGLGPVRWRSME